MAAEGQLLARHRRRRPCRVLLVDEKSMRKGQGQFSTILVDGDRGRVIAVLDGRSADVLGGFLSKQSPAWRKGVSVVVADMAECYRTAGRRWLPNARHVVDRFHVVRNFAKVLVSARRDAQRTPRDPKLFRNRFLLMKRLDRLSGEEMATLGSLFDAHPELGVVWGLVQSLPRDLLRRERGGGQRGGEPARRGLPRCAPHAETSRYSSALADVTRPLPWLYLYAAEPGGLRPRREVLRPVVTVSIPGQLSSMEQHLLPAALIEDCPAGFVEQRSAALDENDRPPWREAAR